MDHILKSFKGGALLIPKELTLESVEQDLSVELKGALADKDIALYGVDIDDIATKAEVRYTSKVLAMNGCF